MLAEESIRSGEIFKGLGSRYDDGDSNCEVLKKLVRLCSSESKASMSYRKKNRYEEKSKLKPINCQEGSYYRRS